MSGFLVNLLRRGAGVDVSAVRTDPVVHAAAGDAALPEPGRPDVREAAGDMGTRTVVEAAAGPTVATMAAPTMVAPAPAPPGPPPAQLIVQRMPAVAGPVSVAPQIAMAAPAVEPSVTRADIRPPAGPVAEVSGGAPAERIEWRQATPAPEVPVFTAAPSDSEPNEPMRPAPPERSPEAEVRVVASHPEPVALREVAHFEREVLEQVRIVPAEPVESHVAEPSEPLAIVAFPGEAAPKPAVSEEHTVQVRIGAIEIHAQAPPVPPAPAAKAAPALAPAGFEDFASLRRYDPWRR